jgi:hypothetical protein
MLLKIKIYPLQNDKIMSTIKKVLVGALLAVVLVSGQSEAAMTWSRSLKSGSKGADVMDLQKFLNMCADTKVSMSGAGSAGFETSTFGPATKAAVMKWQMARGVTPASGLFGPASRAKAAALQASTNVCAGGVVVTPPTGTQTGPVSATLSATTPAAGYIVNNQATAGLLDVTFTGNGVVNSVTLMRSGISDQNTLQNVYLYDGVNRLTDGYSFNSASTITINNLNLAVNGSKTISVKADASATASSNSTIAVALTGFTSGASVNTVNIMGNMMNLATGASLATVKFASANTVSSATVNAGTSAYTFWSAPVQVNTRSVVLKAANFRMIGSAPSDALSNIKLFVDGVDTGKMATVSNINGSNYAAFDFSGAPMNLSTGSHTLDVRANIEKGSNRTVQFSIQQAADLMIMDPQVGINIAIGSLIGTLVPNNAGTISIASGSATLVLDSAFQAMTNVTGGASNTNIGKFKIRAYGEDLKVQTLTVTPSFPTAPTGAAGLDDVTLYFNGTQIGTQQDWTGTALVFNLGSQMIVPAGTDSMLEVRANIRTATTGTNYTDGSVATIINAGVSNAQGQNSYNTANFPGSLVTGNTLTIQTGLLAVSKNTGYANQNANPNTTGVKIGSYVLQNQSSSEGVRVTALQVALGGTSALTNLSALKTSEVSGSGATPVQPQATNTFSVDFTLAPGATKTLDIFADTSTATGVTVIPTLTVTSIGVSSNVSATSAATPGQTITLNAGTLATPVLLTSSATTSQYIAAGGAAGATDATKASYTFVSNGGSATVSELKFTVAGPLTATTVKVGSVSAPVVSGVAYLTGLNLAVPNGGSGLSVDAFISYPEIGTNNTSVLPGATSATSLTYIKYTSGGTTTTITPSIAAPTMTLVGSKPTLTVPTVQNTGLSISGESKIGEVTIAADAKGNIKINDIVFTVSSSGFSTAPTAIASPRIADGNTTISSSLCTPASLVVTCEFGTTGNGDFDGYTIAAGTSKTFSLFGTLTGAAAVGSGTPIVSSSVGISTFNWDDSSTNGASGTSLSGSLIYNFPTSSYSVKQ